MPLDRKIDIPSAESSRESRLAPAQRAVGDGFKRHRQEGAVDHRQNEGQQQPQEGVRVKDPAGLHEGKHDDPDIAAGGENFAMGEVDQLDDAVNHRVPEGDQGIYRPQGESIDDLLEENLHERLPNDGDRPTGPVDGRADRPLSCEIAASSDGGYL